jgi:hypothetical protein
MTPKNRPRSFGVDLVCADPQKPASFRTVLLKMTRSAD